MLSTSNSMMFARIGRLFDESIMRKLTLTSALASVGKTTLLSESISPSASAGHRIRDQSG